MAIYPSPAVTAESPTSLSICACVGVTVVTAEAVDLRVRHGENATLQQLDGAGKLALLEELKTMPFGAVWDALCEKDGVPATNAWMKDVEKYEKQVLIRR